MCDTTQIIAEHTTGAPRAQVCANDVRVSPAHRAAQAAGQQGHSIP